ncbi:CD63 antigen-like 1 [Homarus americanus]|uniref:Tetraspanin n=1 Tax=Homarus americanus TaxID=6706 RepID=A0A8J5K1H9_HOMAM|nr:CD63 antigen-like 1 [Homarus americanus]
MLKAPARYYTSEQISGFAVIIVGAVIEAHYRAYLDFISSSYVSASSILIAVGVLIFVVGFFGCCGAVKENHCMVVTFAVLLCIIFVMQLGVGIASYILRSDVETFLHQNMLITMRNYSDEYPGIFKTWNVIQHEHACCGTDGYKDWELTNFGVEYAGVPDDCCRVNTHLCGQDMFNKSPQEVDKEIHKEGCFDKLKGDVKENVTILGGVAIGIGFVQLIGVAFACCLAKSLRRQFETV